MSCGCGPKHGGDRRRRQHHSGSSCYSGGALDGIARIIAALVDDSHGRCPSGNVIDTVYYKQPTASIIEYDIVDNAQFLSFASSHPLTSSTGAVDLAGTNISYQGQFLKAASKVTETFFLEKTIVGGPSGKLQATLTYDDSPDGVTTTVASNRFLVTAAEGAWKRACFVDIEYNNDTGLRTCRIICHRQGT